MTDRYPDGVSDRAEQHMNDGHRTGGADILQALNDAVRANPLSATLIGLGALWLFSGGNRVALTGGRNRRSLFRVVAENASDLGHATSNAGSAIGGTVSAAADSVRSSVSAAADTITSTISTVADNAVDAVERGRQSLSSAAAPIWDGMRAPPDHPRTLLQQNLRDLFDRNPLFLGAIGLVVGAGVAASLPVSQKEREVLGEASDAVKNKIADMSEQAKSVADAALDEAEQQGVTTHQLKEVGKELRRKVGL